MTPVSRTATGLPLLEEIGIERVSGTDDTLTSVESLLFREQWNASLELFDLAAFRDLLLLHAVAQTAIGLTGELVVATSPAAGRGGMPPASQFGQTVPGTPPRIAPAVPTAAASAVDAPLPELFDAGGVDIDLSDMVMPETPAGADAAANVPMLPSDSALDNLIQFDLPASDTKGKSGEPGRG